MAKNILVITGSPRKNGNSDLLASAFIKGAKEAGAKVKKFEAGRKQLSGCINCEMCFKKGSACAIKDDFQKLEPMIEAADTIVFAFPLYWYSFPAQIKSVIDRIYAYNNKPLNITESVLLISAADESGNVFDGVKKSFKLICNLLKWKNKGIVAANNVWKKGDIKKTDYLAEAENLGKDLA